MPEYLAPGVFVEEISTGAKPIEGVSTSVAGFLGPTERGPEDIRYITSWLEYQRWYGGHLSVDKSYMSYGVQGFFDNGGQRCFVGRIVKGNTQEANRASRALDTSFVISAIGRGAWGNRVFVRVRKATQAKNNVDRAANWVRVTIYYYSAPPPTTPPLDPEDRGNALNANLVRPTVVEDFDNLSLDTAASNGAVTAINFGSKLVRRAQSTPGHAHDRRRGDHAAGTHWNPRERRRCCRARARGFWRQSERDR